MRKTANGHVRHVLITGGAGFIGIQPHGSSPGAYRRRRHHVRQSVAPRGRIESCLAENPGWFGPFAVRARRCPERRSASPRPPVPRTRSITWLRPRPARTCLPNLALDFDINVTGTVNVLEAARKSGRSPIVLFASTGKVYGSLDSIPLKREPTRLEPPLQDSAASLKPLPSTFIAPTPAPRASQTSMSATTRASTTCPPSSSGWGASPARASLATRARDGWPTSSTRCSPAARSPSMEMDSRCATSCMCPTW